MAGVICRRCRALVGADTIKNVMMPNIVTIMETETARMERMTRVVTGVLRRERMNRGV